MLTCMACQIVSAPLVGRALAGQAPANSGTDRVSVSSMGLQASLVDLICRKIGRRKIGRTNIVSPLDGTGEVHVRWG